jgi:hypothetical protein
MNESAKAEWALRRLLDAATAGSVPEHLTVSMCRSSDFAAGWNACRDAMLAAAQREKRA